MEADIKKIKKGEDPRTLYLNLMKKSLTYDLWEGGESFATLDSPLKKTIIQKVFRKIFGNLLAKQNIHLVQRIPYDPKSRAEGKDWPLLADTMIGLKRLDNVQMCVEAVIRENIPGDLIETGVWRGGAVIFMRAVLKVYNVADRIVWCADSFRGLPPPNPEKYPADLGDGLHGFDFLRVSLEQVKKNFARYGLLDENVQFLEGLFKDALPQAPIERLSLMRLDGDMYESTMDALINLYPKLSKGGYVIVDDYGVIAGCQRAVDDFRKSIGVNDKIHQIDSDGVYWRRSV